MSRGPRILVVVGLGYGDEGKGSVVDHLVRRELAAAAVRYNGGRQAARHVVEPGGRRHCFSQFGSGSLVPGIRTHLSRQMPVKFPHLLAEARAIAAPWRRWPVAGQRRSLAFSWATRTMRATSSRSHCELLSRVSSGSLERKRRDL